ncbi:hypothetical protein [Olleya aquimaris]|uniref:Uncharacterized protein n=1 Tax=Olleya aquimaris TaxID=639310 RepID=A0A327RIL8_9FLAO|nr:hypothetical protein [Olleya aquimaris]RAJ16800.1 hypothetical protein LY08_00575 [Olleya aquimaris]
MKIKIYLIAIILLLHSCKDEKKVEHNIVKNNLFGKHYNLSKDNIDIYLPNTLQQYSVDQYESVLASIEDSIARQSELLRFNILKFSKKNVYFFRTPNHTTDVTVKMMDYYPFTKQDSKYLSALLSQSCRESADVANSTCTKLRSGYSGTPQTKAFMAKFKIDSDKEPSSFATIYAVSSNYKSFIITFRSLLNRNYNKFIEKTIVK